MTLRVEDARPLRRMRTITTWTFFVVFGIYGGVVLVAASTAWYGPLLLAPSIVLALWLAARWDSPVPAAVTWTGLLVGEVTWAAGALLDLTPGASFGIAVAGAVTVSRLPRYRARAAAGLIGLVLTTGLLTLISASEQAVSYLLIAPAMTAIWVGVFWINHTAWQLVIELDASRRAETELALVKERFRFASDLHDIQGHTLHVAKLKIALAQKVLRADPDAAAAELAEVQALIGDTITQTRSLAYGQRTLNLAGELENAKNLFQAAGIHVDLTVEPILDPRHDEQLGQVLREATTNILRHAQATDVRITVTDTGISIRNDGSPPGSQPPLRGLATLTERIADLGGQLSAVKTGDTFTTSASFAVEGTSA